jgi:hypothetical protein
MDKLVHIITIGQWNYYSKTGDFSQMEGVNSDNVAAIDGIIAENLGEFNFDKETRKLNSKYKIQELITLYRNLNHLMVHRLKVDKWLDELGVKNTFNVELDKAIETKCEILNINHSIKVENIDDLKKIEKEIERRTDKFKENFKEPENKEKGATFSEVVISVFKRAGYDKIDYSMILSDFFILVKQIIKK